MSYSDNLLVNGNLELSNLNNWMTSNVSIDSIPFSGEKYFALAATASMEQTLANLTFTLQPLHCKLTLKFRYAQPASVLDSTVDAYAQVEYQYVDNEVDVFVLPLIEAFGTSEAKDDGIWYTLDSTCPLRNNAILQEISVHIVTNSLAGGCLVREVSIQRSLADAEIFDINSQLPVSITVSQEEGIKATYGFGTPAAEVRFWLRPDGSAYLKGEIQADSGVFGSDPETQIRINNDGTVTIPMLTITGLGDYTDTMDGWMVPGTTTINGANIATGTITADKIATNSLIVGENVQMGSGAIITWANLTEEVQDMLGIPGPPGPQGPPGDPADADIPDWIYQWNNGHTTIADGYILSPNIFAGQGGQMTTGIKINENGITSYQNAYKNGISLNTEGTLELYDNNVNTMEFRFDTNGPGTEGQDAERVFLTSLNGYALKIQTDDANMSIVAGGTVGSGYEVFVGDVCFMGTVRGLNFGNIAVFG